MNDRRKFGILPVTMGVISPLGVATATEMSTPLPISIAPKVEQKEERVNEQEEVQKQEKEREKEEEKVGIVAPISGKSMDRYWEINEKKNKRKFILEMITYEPVYASRGKIWQERERPRTQYIITHLFQIRCIR